MWSHEEAQSIVQIYDVLYQLGITANYIGFFHTAYAVWLCAQNPERLQLVTKWLYPDVAERYKTNWKAVERNIRSIIALVWDDNLEQLNELAGYRLIRRPRPAQFLSILVKGVFPEGVSTK